MKILARIIIILFSSILPISMGLVGFTAGKGLAKQPVTVNSIQSSIRNKPEIENISSIPKAIENFELEIPKIDFKKDIEQDVNMYDQNIYEPVISSKIAHGKYSLTPEQLSKLDSGVIYLFGHREGESGFFSRLGELEKGDKITIVQNGNEYLFEVKSTKVIPSSQTTDLLESNGEKILRLQTCENGQKDRLIIDAVMKTRI